MSEKLKELEARLRETQEAADAAIIEYNQEMKKVAKSAVIGLLKVNNFKHKVFVRKNSGEQSLQLEVHDGIKAKEALVKLIEEANIMTRYCNVQVYSVAGIDLLYEPGEE